MPNWVKTIVKTKPDVLKDIMNKYSDKGVLSFDKIIPMPKELDIDSSSSGEMGLMYLFIESTDDIYKLKVNTIFHSLNVFHSDIYRDKRFENIEDNFEKYKVDPDFTESIELGRKYIENYDKFGYCNWYNWCTDHWGTKWDLSKSSNDETTLIFETAWGFAGNVILKLSEIYPNTLFKCEFADEGIKENSGVVEIQNGEVFKEKYELSEYKINKIWDTYLPDQERDIEFEIEI